MRDYRVKFSDWADMNHVEAQVLDCLAKLYAETFTTLADYCQQHRHYADPVIRQFDREIQFYVGYIDVALASKLVAESDRVVCNDLYLRDPERIFVVTGPNQGGKTTFARTFGQLHYLASLGPAGARA